MRVVSSILLGVLIGLVPSAANTAFGRGMVEPRCFEQAASEQEPGVSADERRIAFELYEDGRVVVADMRSGEVRFSSKSGYANSPVWHPRREELFFLDKELGALVGLVGPDFDRRALAKGDNLGMSQWAVSPSGDEIVFSRGRSLVVMDIESGRERTLYTAPEEFGSPGTPSWSPTGSRVLFHEGPMVVAIDGSNGREESRIGPKLGRARFLDESTVVAEMPGANAIATFETGRQVERREYGGTIQGFDVDFSTSPSRLVVAVKGRGLLLKEAEEADEEKALVGLTTDPTDRVPRWFFSGRGVAFLRGEGVETRACVLRLD